MRLKLELSITPPAMLLDNETQLSESWSVTNSGRHPMPDATSMNAVAMKRCSSRLSWSRASSLAEGSPTGSCGDMCT
jgi:hypothetical protein